MTTTKSGGMGRRGFLKALAAGAAAPLFIPASALGRDGRPAPSERVALALIGCGGMGLINIRNFLPLPGVEVVAVCDADRVHRERMAAFIRQQQTQELGYEQARCDEYHAFEEMLERADIDAVVNATPDHWHAGITIAAAKAGKHIYGEKPLARTIAEGRSMVDIVRRHGVVFQTGTQSRSNGTIQRVIELVRNGAVGNLQRIEGWLPQYGGGPVVAPSDPPEELDYDRWLGPAPWRPYIRERVHGNFRVTLDYSGGTITDHGVHRCDVAAWGAGKELEGPVRVEGEAQYPRDGIYDAPTVATFELRYRDGLVITMHTEPDESNWGARFHGDEGWIHLPTLAPLPHLPVSASNPRLLSMPVRPDQRVVRPSNDHWGNFIDCVRTGAEPVAPIGIGHNSTTLTHLGNIAMELGRPVDWDAASESFPGDAAANAKLDTPKREPWARFFKV